MHGRGATLQMGGWVQSSGDWARYCVWETAAIWPLTHDTLARSKGRAFKSCLHGCLQERGRAAKGKRRNVKQGDAECKATERVLFHSGAPWLIFSHQFKDVATINSPYLPSSTHTHISTNTHGLHMRALSPKFLHMSLDWVCMTERGNGQVPDPLR